MNNERLIINDIKKLSNSVGVGDDAFVLDSIDRNKKIVISTDAFYENVHFKLDWFSLEDLAFRLASSAISDIAAMGGVFKYLFNTISYNDKYAISVFLRGLNRAVEFYGGSIAGGDLTGGRDFSVSITVLGETEKPILRTGIRDGDKIFVTGTLGEASLGLWCLKNKLYSKDAKYFIKHFKRPIAELKRGQEISKYASSMIDLSDGLINELSILSEQNNMGVVLNTLPVSKRLLTFTEQESLDWKEYVLYGGEDFKLLYTARNSFNSSDIELGYFVRKVQGVYYNGVKIIEKTYRHF